MEKDRNKHELRKDMAIVVFLLPLILFVVYGIYKEQSSYFPLEDVSIQIGEDSIQNIPLWRNEENGIYYAFLPSETKQVCFDIPWDRNVTIGSETFESGECITDLNWGEEYSISLNTAKAHCVDSGTVVFLLADSVPTLYITAPNCYDVDQLVKEKDNSIRTIVDLYDTKGNLNLSSECTINGRGNTSWNEKKKPYSLKFDEAVSLLGMDEQKKWALIANSSDPSLLRNKIAYTLAEQSGCQYTPQTEYVNVYVNGSFQGIYLLTQQISAEDGCLDWNETEQNYLFEIDGRYEQETNWFMAGIYGIVYSSNEYIYEDKIRSIEENFASMLSTFSEADSEEFLDYCAKYIDVESWIKQYIISEFLVNVDLDYASQFFFSEEESTILYAGPIWDYDNSMGIFSTMDCRDLSPYLQWARGRDGSWFSMLMEHEAFRKEYEEYYEQFFSDLIINMIEKEIPAYVECIDSSTHMDAVRWKGGNDTFEEDSEQVINWLTKRKAFYDDYWNDPESYVRIQFSENGWKDYVYCIKSGTPLDHYPQSYLYGDTSWVDSDGNVVKKGTIMDDNIKLYPVYEE